MLPGKEKNWRADINEIRQDMEISHLTRFASLVLSYFFFHARQEPVDISDNSPILSRGPLDKD